MRSLQAMSPQSLIFPPELQSPVSESLAHAVACLANTIAPCRRRSMIAGGMQRPARSIGPRPAQHGAHLFREDIWAR